MNEDLKKQVEEWHEEDCHQEIIDALLCIPASERDFETNSLLARAYNNNDEYDKAEELLESLREEGEEDVLWNYRMGYSKHFLDKNEEALVYFKKAYKLDPDDEDALFFIRQCNINVPLSERVERFWKWFAENEEKISGMVRPRTQEEADEVMALVQEGTSLISDNVNYNLGGDCEFSFSAEGWPDMFIIYPYIISCMPEELKSKWKFNPFNGGTDRAFGFSMFGADMDTARVMVRAVFNEDAGRFRISFYEPNLCALSPDESRHAMWIMLENTVGEGVSFKYIDGIDQAAECEDGMIPLPELKQHIRETLEAHELKFFENPVDVYTSYKLNQQDNTELRFDVVVGSTRLDAIIADYYHDSTDIFDHINSFGAQAVFIAFANPEGMDGNSILNLRHDIEDKITEEILDPLELGLVIGGATGTDVSYIDLIVYDYNTFEHAITFLQKQFPECRFFLSDFRRHAGHTPLL